MSTREDNLLAAIAKAVDLLSTPNEHGQERVQESSMVLRQALADIADSDERLARETRVVGRTPSDEEIEHLLTLDHTSNDFREQCDGDVGRALLIEVQDRRKQARMDSEAIKRMQDVGLVDEAIRKNVAAIRRALATEAAEAIRADHHDEFLLGYAQLICTWFASTKNNESVIRLDGLFIEAQGDRPRKDLGDWEFIVRRRRVVPEVGTDPRDQWYPGADGVESVEQLWAFYCARGDEIMENRQKLADLHGQVKGYQEMLAALHAQTPEPVTVKTEPRPAESRRDIIARGKELALQRLREGLPLAFNNPQYYLEDALRGLVSYVGTGYQNGDYVRIDWELEKAPKNGHRFPCGINLRVMPQGNGPTLYELPNAGLTSDRETWAVEIAAYVYQAKRLAEEAAEKEA